MTIPEKTSLKPKKLFFPTLGDTKSYWFWFGMVMFFSFYNMVIQFPTLADFRQGWVAFFKIVVENFCVIFGTIGYVHLSAEKFQKVSPKEQFVYLLLVNLLMTPLTMLLAKVIQFVVLQDLQVFSSVAIEIIISTFLSMLVTALLMYYFTNQYHIINATQKRYQQKLIEQNAQLKARITPHFFFNMLNTVQGLIELEPEQASEIIEKVAKLYRFSFYEAKEIALTDEIELCQDYLDIEKYRFEDRLQVTWELPDEDTLYDMVIASLTLQMLIEKMITGVVELTSQKIDIHIGIIWENGLVEIFVTTRLPTNLPDNLLENLNKNLSFQAQQDNLQRFFGKTASIGYHIEKQQDIIKKLVIQAQYPLIDVV